MDSMRNLTTSLPGSGRRRADGSELLTDFKAAALSVTNLYKSAVSAQIKSRAAGYQDALDDLLVFLDRENMGLMDGEGWRVRQWATERLDDGILKQAASEDEEEAGKEEEATVVETRSTSPETQRKPAVTRAASERAETPSSQAAELQPAEQQSSSSPAPQVHTAPTAQDFTFRSTHTYPTNHEREGGMDVDATSSAAPSSTESVRVVARPHRNRHGRPRGENRTLNLNLGSGAGSKRKIPYPDFFDISGINFDNLDRRDGPGGRGGGGGGKRSRHV